MSLAQQILAATTDDKSSAVVAREVGAEPSYVRNVWKRAGRTPRTKRRPRLAVVDGVPGDIKNVQVALDWETVVQVRNRAERAGVSVSEMIRTYIEWGLEAE